MVRLVPPDEACPGCGCKPGEGITETCNHPQGCGFWKEQHKKEVRRVPTNPDVYPITAKFEEETAKFDLNEMGKAIRDRMIEHIGEYEHGTAEPDVLLDESLQESFKTKLQLASTDDERDDIEQDRRNAALKTMSEMYQDLLGTYWVNDAT